MSPSRRNAYFREEYRNRMLRIGIQSGAKREASLWRRRHVTSWRQVFRERHAVVIKCKNLKALIFNLFCS